VKKVAGRKGSPLKRMQTKDLGKIANRMNNLNNSQFFDKSKNVLDKLFQDTDDGDSDEEEKPK